MCRLLLLITIAITSFSVLGANEKLQAALDKALVDNNVSAMQMTIILPSQEHLTFTATKKNSPTITNETLFQIGSETKSYTAALILKLESLKQLKLSDTVGKYFPQYKAWAGITLSQLLHNNSGIPSYTENKAFQKSIEKNPQRPWKPEELVAIAAKMKMNFKPGKGWHYSNTNFILAGMIAQKITKQSLAQLYQSYFLTPLNLSDTYYLPTVYTKSFIDRMVHGYDEKNRDVIHDNMSWAGSAGAMVSNSIDLADWAYALFHNKALPEDATKKMMNLVSVKSGGAIKPNEDGYGLGIGMRYSKEFGRWYGHEGETLGYHVIFLWFEKLDLTIAVLTNGEAKNLREFATSLPGL